MKHIYPFQRSDAETGYHRVVIRIEICINIKQHNTYKSKEYDKHYENVKSHPFTSSIGKGKNELSDSEIAIIERQLAKN